MIKGKSELEQEKKEVQVEYFTSAASIIKSLFSEELSGPKWHKYTKQQVLDLVDEKAKELKVPDDRYIILLKRSLTKAKDVPDMLFRMEKYLLGDSQ